ncbi:MAG: Hsp20/alpha crystallin family protein [Parvibaculaceae bacterium]
MASKSQKKSVAAPKSPSTETSIWSDPFHGFRSEVDHLIDRFFGRSSGFPDKDFFSRTALFEGGDMSPNIDIRENDKKITLTAELPGMEEKDVDLSVKDRLLTLKGEKKYEHEDKKDDAVRIERRYGSFRRSFTLPSSVDEEGIKASFDKGVLTVEMPKKPGAKSDGRSIPIS